MLWLLISITLLGFILLILGVRGRLVGREPRCRKCRFDLTGLDTDSAGSVCPECGRSVSSSKSVRFGVRKRRYLLILVSLAMVVAPPAVRLSNFDWTSWNDTKPMLLLTLDLRFGTRAVRAAAAEEALFRWENDGISLASKRSLANLAGRRMGQGVSLDFDWVKFAVIGHHEGLLDAKHWVSLSGSMQTIAEALTDDLGIMNPHIVFDQGSSYPFPQNQQLELGFLPQRNSPIQAWPGVTLSWALQEVSFNGEKIALIENAGGMARSPNRSRRLFQYLSNPSFGYGTQTRTHRLPTDRSTKRLPMKPVWERESNELSTLGKDLFTLPTGSNACDSRWVGYIGFDLFPFNSVFEKAEQPHLFGPFVFEKQITINLFHSPLDITQPTPPAELKVSPAQITPDRLGIQITGVTVKGPPDPRGYVECRLKIKESLQPAPVLIASEFQLDLDGQRRTVFWTKGGIKPDGTRVHSYRVMLLNAVPNNEPSIVNLRSPMWVFRFDSRPATCDVVLSPSPESRAAIMNFATLAAISGHPVPILGSEIRWENVPIEYVNMEND